ncbi:MAG: NAD(P)H-dependent oxidoreductase subunit E [Bacteroidota bacterium]
MSYEHEITICVGSSCFSRGNKKLVQLIKQYLKGHNLTQKVYFHGSHCYGQCERGPVMIMDGQAYFHIDEDKALTLIQSKFG